MPIEYLSFVAYKFYAQEGFLAGDDARRAAEIMECIERPEVGAIFCARGGYGSARILPLLDAAKIHGKKEFFELFDYICAFDAIHDQSYPLEALKGIRYMLAPGGMFSMIDIKASSNQADNVDHPMGPFLYTVSLMHCMPVGLNDNGTGLGMMWGQEKAEAILGALKGKLIDTLITDDKAVEKILKID